MLETQLLNVPDQQKLNPDSIVTSLRDALPRDLVPALLRSTDDPSVSHNLPETKYAIAVFAREKRLDHPDTIIFDASGNDGVICSTDGDSRAWVNADINEVENPEILLNLDKAVSSLRDQLDRIGIKSSMTTKIATTFLKQFDEKEPTLTTLRNLVRVADSAILSLRN